MQRNIAQETAAILPRLRETRPLIHHITNNVSMNDCANITLAIGASPVMADDVQEVDEMVAFASALVLNLGMPNPRKTEAMLIAGKRAAQKGIPIVFDPVGVGTTKLRMETAKRFFRELNISVVRGNLAECKALLGFSGGSQGVDCILKEEYNENIAQELAIKLGCVVAITGATDIVASGSQLCRIHNGNSLLAGITGTGCMTTSLIACFSSVNRETFSGTVAGIAAMGVAGEIAQHSLKSGEGLGTFRIRLMDAISNMKQETLLNRMKIS